MVRDFLRITGPSLADGFPFRTFLPAEVAGLRGLKDTRALRLRIAERTSTLTLLAGSGSRWVSSLKEARDSVQSGDYDHRDVVKAGGTDRGTDPSRWADPARGASPDEPRGLFPVRNAMGFGPEPVPIAGYALAAVRDLGRHAIVVRGWEEAIEQRLLLPLGFEPGSWSFRTQEAPGGKPRGHGDAAFQAMDLWSAGDYVIVNFGGDASSPLSAFAGLAVMDALCAVMGDEAPGLLMPVALAHEPAYPIEVDQDGLPRSFGHAKLKGSGGSLRAAGDAYTNVGLRIYRAKVLAQAISRIRTSWWSAGGGYAIPGNDPSGGEFALDNVDAMLAEGGRARLLHVCRPQELSPVKSLADVPRFERDIGIVCGDWAVDL
ncbi:MAG: hypothetical protein AB7T74_05505 [Clostridia bacterium]